MGPPRAPPNWFRLKGFFAFLAPEMGLNSLLKKLRASRASLRRNSKPSPWNSFAPERVAMFTIEPELRPYSALYVELLILNSETVLIDGWKVIWPLAMSFRLTPLIWKLVVSSRFPAVTMAKAPWPRSGLVRKAFCTGGTTV